MRLIQTKIRCVEGVVDTGWFVPGRETTVIYGPVGSGKRQLLTAMQALNPPYDIHVRKPFQNHPLEWRQGAHTRRVIPHKKTAVVMVFSAGPQLVRELDEIDPALIETDRVEVGRRLDYSRWITFVEISASTRWSDIAEPMRVLREHVRKTGDNIPADVGENFFSCLAPTDRLKGQIAEDCRTWLRQMAPLFTGDHRILYERCLEAVGRADRFAQARSHVQNWLPLTLYVHPGGRLQSSYSMAEPGQGPAPTDLVCQLLQVARERFRDPTGTQLPAGEFNAQADRIRESMCESLVAAEDMPRVALDAGNVTLHGNLGETILQQRLRYLLLVCLFAELASGRRPLLLIDGFDCDLDSGEEVAGMVSALQQIGRYCQLIFTTEHKEAVDRAGWQGILQIGPRGLGGGARVEG